MLVVLLHVPPVQAFIGSQVAQALSEKFGTEVSVGEVDLGFFNRIIVDDVNMLDQHGDSMIYASRLSAKIDLLPLKEGKISVSSAQLFGLNANLYKQDAKSEANFQFVLDSLASKDTTSHKPLDLHIGSIIIRHGAVAYNQRDEACKPGVFSPKHIGLNNISAHVILEHLTDNSIQLMVKKIALTDKSGLQLKNLHFKLTADRSKATLSDFYIQLPHSQLKLEDIHATYRMEEKKLIVPSLQYHGGILSSEIKLEDIARLSPTIRKFDETLRLNLWFSGQGTSARIHRINLHTQSQNIVLKASGSVNHLDSTPSWCAEIKQLKTSSHSIQQVADRLGKSSSLPKEVTRLGNICFTGSASGQDKNLAVKGTLTTDAGSLSLKAKKNGSNLQASADTKDTNLGRILDTPSLGILAANVNVQGYTKHLKAQGFVARLDFNKYSFKDIKLDCSYNNGLVAGAISITDPNANVSVSGSYSIPQKEYEATAYIQHLLPSITGLKVADKSYCLADIHLSAKNCGNDGYLKLEAPFASVRIDGKYTYGTLAKSFTNLVASKLPTLPGIGTVDRSANNHFYFQSEITSTEPLRRLLGVKLDISRPIAADGFVNDAEKTVNLYASLPEFCYNGAHYHDMKVRLHTEGDSLMANAQIRKGMLGQRGPVLQAEAKAADNNLMAKLTYDNHSANLPIKGLIDTKSQFYKDECNVSTAHVAVQPSEIIIGDTAWKVHPANIIYKKNHLEIDHFAVNHDGQHIIVNGIATPNSTDSIVADLKDVNVAYILSLVNFHSVDFAGKASGQAIMKSLFQSPDAYASLDIKDFTFENGPMGVLHANAAYNKVKEQIDIDAVADDGPGHQTLINGYVSPKRNYIDLDIEAQTTRLKFMESFCGSFMDDIEAWGTGKLKLAGDLSNINLTGDINASGKIHLKQLNTWYTFDNLRAHAIPDDIQLQGDTIYDRNHNIAIVSGGIHHKHLTRLSYDLDIAAHNFLGFDTHGFGDDTFYGTIFATGTVGIHGKSGETTIDIDAEPCAGSTFVYNVASPDAIKDKSFIHWHEIQPEQDDSIGKQKVDQAKKEYIGFNSDMIINFLIRTNKNLTLKLIMDEQTGDFITLNGDGVIRANYFNKGSFDMFGNYVVDHGTYKLTIQNIIRKEFVFMQGGSITFGGNPYNAPLNLKAKYTVNGVPLSDLKIGRSFSSNNIRVDCLMNITGTPQTPKVDFSMDMPTVNSDAKQMIYSLINSQEEMNQQVLYLLGIGRFYAQANNNSRQMDEGSNEQQSQTSLAMQSFLSGTISQQISSVLSKLMNNNNWNFGANISTGDEGFQNAEYEGTLSGSLLNNRLLFNGQFGYRDNPNTTQSFIGDFDLRYLIFPNGNLAIRMYNQTNDRYFTRNSLNTQGLGLIMKKDFNGWRDLFGIKKKKTNGAKKKKTNGAKKKRKKT